MLLRVSRHLNLRLPAFRSRSQCSVILMIGCSQLRSRKACPSLGLSQPNIPTNRLDFRQATARCDLVRRLDPVWGSSEHEGQPLSEEQIIGILKEQEAGVSVADLCRKYGAVTPAPPNLAKPTVSAKSGLEKTSGQGSRALHVRCIPEDLPFVSPSPRGCNQSD